MEQDTRHLPNAALIESYGNGGFRFGGMSHRGSILCLPNGVWASRVTTAAAIDEAALALVFANAEIVKHCLIGTGMDPAIIPAPLRQKLHDSGIAVETMTTGAAVRTYNILLDENRPVAALLIAVG